MESGGKPRYCKLGSQECCAVQGDSGGSQTTYKCVSTAALTCLGTDAITIPCDDNAQCSNNQICCGTTDQSGSYYASVSCQSSCNGGGQFVFCDPNALPDVCTALGNGSTCTASQILPGYFVCN